MLGRRLRRDQSDQHGLCVWRRPARRHAYRPEPRGQHARTGAGARARRLPGHAGRAAARLRHLRPRRPRRPCRSRSRCRGCARPVGDAPAAARGRWTPSPLNLLFFVVALGADGVFTATLSTLLADIIPVTAALIGAGLLLAAQRLVSVILSFVSGPIIDRLKARPRARAVQPRHRRGSARDRDRPRLRRRRRADRRRVRCSRSSRRSSPRSNRPTGSARSPPTRPGRTAGSRPAPSSASSGWNGPATPTTYAWLGVATVADHRWFMFRATVPPPARA